MHIHVAAGSSVTTSHRVTSYARPVCSSPELARGLARGVAKANTTYRNVLVTVARPEVSSRRISRYDHITATTKQ